MKTINFAFYSGLDIAYRYNGEKANLTAAAQDHDYFERDFRSYQVDKCIRVDSVKAATIEKETKLQSKNVLWHKERQWRLTASKFGEICKATDKKDIEMLCETLLDPPKLATIAINHGKTYESVAIKKFEDETNQSVEKCGFFVNPDFPFLGASPDGRVNNETIIEVKCPYSGRNNSVIPGKMFPFLAHDENNVIHLKENHNYYYQIMGQLAITKCRYCFFIVYTTKELLVQKIEFDPKFFDEKMLPKLEDFFNSCYRPFIASKLQISI